MTDVTDSLSDVELCDALQDAAEAGDMTDYDRLANEVVRRFTEYVAEGRISRHGSMARDLDHEIGDAVAVLPHTQGGHRQDGSQPLSGTVTNRRRDNGVYQYLVDIDDGGRVWYDAGAIVTKTAGGDD